MKLFLPKLAADAVDYETECLIEHRLPRQVSESCKIKCALQVTGQADKFFLLELKLEGMVPIQCMRCLNQFEWEYKDELVLAVCDAEEKAEQLMENYECIVSNNYHLLLDELIIDTLHLVVPEKHPNEQLCEEAIKQYISL